MIKCALVIRLSLIGKGKDAVLPPCRQAVGGRLHAWRCGNEVVQEFGLESIQGRDLIDLLQQIFKEIGVVEIQVITEMDVGL